MKPFTLWEARPLGQDRSLGRAGRVRRRGKSRQPRVKAVPSHATALETEATLALMCRRNLAQLEAEISEASTRSA